MYVCKYICEACNVYMYLYVCTYMYLYVCTYMYLYVCTYLISRYVMYILMYFVKSKYVCMYVCIQHVYL